MTISGYAGVAVTPDGAFAYVTSSGGADTSVISTATNTVVATVPVTGYDVAVTPDGTSAYVVGSSVSVISTATNTVAATIPVDGVWLAFGPGSSATSPVTLAQGPPTSAAVTAGAGYSGQLTVTNATGAVGYTGDHVG